MLAQAAFPHCHPNRPGQIFYANGPTFRCSQCPGLRGAAVDVWKQRCPLPGLPRLPPRCAGRRGAEPSNYRPDPNGEFTPRTSRRPLHARRNARQAGSRFLTPSFFCCLFSYGSCAWHPSLWLRLCTRYPSCVCIDSVGSIVFSLKLMVSLMLELSPFVVTKTYYSLQKWQIEQIGVSLSWIRFSLLTPSWSLYATGKGWI